MYGYMSEIFTEFYESVNVMQCIRKADYLYNNVRMEQCSKTLKSVQMCMSLKQRAL